MKEPHHHLNTQNTCKAGHSSLKDHCKPCQALKREWYKTLQSAGFDDIERRLNSVGGDLSSRKDFQSIDAYEAKVSYFSWASQMLEQGSFRSLKDQMIWEFHAEGMSRREISERIDLDHTWCSRKIVQIRSYLSQTTASLSAAYG